MSFVTLDLTNAPEAKAQRVVNQLKAAGVQSIRQDIAICNQVLLAVWCRQNEGQLSVADVLAEFGTDAAEAFRGHAAKCQYLLTTYPDAIKTQVIPIAFCGVPPQQPAPSAPQTEQAAYQQTALAYGMAQAQVQAAVSAGDTLLLRPTEATVTVNQDGSVTAELP